MTIEIVVFNIASAIAAQQGGAQRVEVCDNPAEGGTTPSVGILKVLREKLTIEIAAMIRPRGGDFVYTDEEFAAMLKDIEVCKELQLNAVVFGILLPDGRLDKKRCAQLIAAAHPMQTVCHRAFDTTPDLLTTLDDCIEVGFDRILTSGGAQNVEAGLDMIATLVKRADGRIAIMPGGGVTEHNVMDIVTHTGVQDIHFSAKQFIPSLYGGKIVSTENLPTVSGLYLTNAETVKRIHDRLK